MKRMNFPHRRLKRRSEAEARNAKTPIANTKRFRINYQAQTKGGENQ